MDHLHHDDRVLRPALFRMAQTLRHSPAQRFERFGVQSGRFAHPALHAAPKRVAQRQTSIALGRDPQHSVRPARLADHRALRVQSETNERQAVSLDGAHDRAQLRLLHSRRLVGRANPGHRHAHDSQDVRLRLDDLDRLSGDEKRHAKRMTPSRTSATSEPPIFSI